MYLIFFAILKFFNYIRSNGFYILPKFEFKHLDWTGYRRFIELLSEGSVYHVFSLTDKKNYANCIKNRGIYTSVTENKHGRIKFYNATHLVLEISSDDDFSRNVQKISKFLPYLRIGYLNVDEYNINLTKFLLPKTYKKLHVFNIESTANIDRVSDIYYHKDIEFISGHFNGVVDNEKLYRIINYAINKMPVKKFSFNISRREKDTVDDLIKVLQIPDAVKMITIVHEQWPFQLYNPAFYEKRWKIIR